MDVLDELCAIPGLARRQLVLDTVEDAPFAAVVLNVAPATSSLVPGQSGVITAASSDEPSIRNCLSSPTAAAASSTRCTNGASSRESKSGAAANDSAPVVASMRNWAASSPPVME